MTMYRLLGYLLGYFSKHFSIEVRNYVMKKILSRQLEVRIYGSPQWRMVSCKKENEDFLMWVHTEVGSVLLSGVDTKKTV